LSLIDKFEVKSGQVGLWNVHHLLSVDRDCAIAIVLCVRNQQHLAVYNKVAHARSELEAFFPFCRKPL
jgi:hypothetical protein